MKQLLIIVFLVSFYIGVAGQSRRELEEQRRKTLEDISYVDNMIKETEKQKVTGINDIRILGNRLNMRERIIGGMKEEIELLSERIELNTLALNLMERDLDQVRNQYREAIINSYKSAKGYPLIGYVLSARDFNQGYKRMRYLQQMAKFRRNEVELIMELIKQIEATRSKMEEDLANISDLKTREEAQRALIRQEQERKRRMVNNLSARERQLRKELEEKRVNAKKIETEINRLIEEERKRSSSMEMTPEMRLISEDFAGNRGRLPWPVERGIITGKFGPQPHPVLSNVVENNPGIEISSSGKVKARAVFKGQVVRIFAIQGENMSIIIRHGRFYTVYQNLINISVKQGQAVETRQELGEVYYESDKVSASVLKFMIFEEREKLDPEMWIAKNR